MIPTNLVQESFCDKMAADSATVAPAATANTIYFVANPFVPSPDITFADVNIATTEGVVNGIECPVGAQLSSVDPLTKANQIVLKTPVDGYTVVVGTPNDPPEVIYGYMLVKPDSIILATELLPNPITLDTEGAMIQILAPQIDIPRNAYQ